MKDTVNTINVNADNVNSADSNFLLAALKATRGDIENSRNEITASGLNNIMTSSFIAKGDIVGDPNQDDSVLRATTRDPDVGDIFKSTHVLTTMLRAKGDITDFSTVQFSELTSPATIFVNESTISQKTLVDAGKNLENFSNQQLLSNTLPITTDKIETIHNQLFELNVGKDIVGSFSSKSVSQVANIFLDVSNTEQNVSSHVDVARDIIFNQSGTWDNMAASQLIAQNGPTINSTINAHTETLVGRNVIVDNSDASAALVRWSTNSISSIDNQRNPDFSTGEYVAQSVTDIGKNLIVTGMTGTVDATQNVNETLFFNQAELLLNTSGPLDMQGEGQATLNIGKNLIMKSTGVEGATTSSSVQIQNISLLNLNESGRGDPGTRELNQTTVAHLTVGKNIDIVSSNTSLDPAITTNVDMTNAGLAFSILESPNVEITGSQSAEAVLKTGHDIIVATDSNFGQANLTNKADSFFTHTSRPLSVDVKQVSSALLQSKRGDIMAKGENSAIINSADAGSENDFTTTSGTQSLTATIKAGGTHQC